MKNKKTMTCQRRVAVALASVVLAAGLPAMGMAAAADPAVQNAHPNANLGVGNGTAPVPEASTWVGMGTLLAAGAALVAIQRRRRSRA